MKVPTEDPELAKNSAYLEGIIITTLRYSMSTCEVLQPAPARLMRFFITEILLEKLYSILLIFSYEGRAYTVEFGNFTTTN